jgi:hypothetical protein
MSGKLRTRRSGVLFVLALSVSVLAEARGPGLPSPDPERGALAVTVRGRFPLGQKAPAAQVYFVRVDDDADMFSAESVIPSNFSKKKQVYLLNAKPGRYVAVAARLAPNAGLTGTNWVVFFDRAMIARTETEVAAGQITFLGDLLVDLKVKMSGADEAQTHYLRLVEPAAARAGFTLRALAGDYVYRGELVETDRTPATEGSFWALARDKIFNGEAGWRSMVEQRLAAPGQR